MLNEIKELQKYLIIPKPNKRARRANWCVQYINPRQYKNFPHNRIVNSIKGHLRDFPKIKTYIFKIEEDEDNDIYIRIFLSLKDTQSDPRRQLRKRFPDATLYIAENKQVVKYSCLNTVANGTGPYFFGITEEKQKFYMNKYHLVLKKIPTPKELEVIEFYKELGYLSEEGIASVKNRLKFLKEYHKSAKANYKTFCIKPNESIEDHEKISRINSLKLSKDQLDKFIDDPHSDSEEDQTEEKTIGPYSKEFYKIIIEVSNKAYKESQVLREQKEKREWEEQTAEFKRKYYEKILGKPLIRKKKIVIVE